MTPAPVIQSERPCLAPLVITEQNGRLVATFATEVEALAWLKARGFSVGRMQAGSPRGILFGDFDIQKWRNLRPADRAELHGLMISGRHAVRASVALYPGAPTDVRQAFIDGAPL
jgi:hypothetical protein